MKRCDRSPKTDFQKDVFDATDWKKRAAYSDVLGGSSLSIVAFEM